MKEVKAILRRFKVAEVVTALAELEDLPGVTVSEVQGFGRSRAQGAADAVEHDGVRLVRKSKLEIVVPDAMTDEVIEIIQRHGRTGNPGNGKIFVIPVEKTITIRTGRREGHRA